MVVAVSANGRAYKNDPALFALALAAGASPAEGATLANLAGGIVVTKLGTATASRAELHRAIDLASFVHD